MSSENKQNQNQGSKGQQINENHNSKVFSNSLDIKTEGRTNVERCISTSSTKGKRP